MNIKKLAIKGVQLFEFNRHEDSRGVLTVANMESEIPFLPRRYFLIYGVPENMIRGQHAHKECHQFLVCTSGKCRVLVDDGHQTAEVVLDQPSHGLYLPPLIWGTQFDYSKEACLMVLASHLYDKSDYITDYEEFKKLVR